MTNNAQEFFMTPVDRRQVLQSSVATVGAAAILVVSNVTQSGRADAKEITTSGA
jgi:hypothetical protein